MRRKDREVTNEQEILKIVDTAKFLHLGLFDDVFPYIVPLHYGYTFQNGTFIFYIHTAKAGHKLDLIWKNPNVCVELTCDVEPISGGDNPCGYGAWFASFIGRGTAELASGAEKEVGLQQLLRHQSGRAFAVDERMLAAVEIIKVTVPNFTAKAHRKAVT